MEPTSESSAQSAGESRFEAPDGGRGWHRVAAFALARGFRNDKLRFLAMILDVLKVNPLLVVHLGLFCRDPGWITFGFIGCGALIGQLFINIKIQVATASVWLRVFSGVVQSCPGAEFARQRAVDYCGEQRIQDMERWLLKGMMRPGVDEFIRIFQIRTDAIVKNYQTFSSPMFGSFVFVISPAEEASALQKMVVLHELGHAVHMPVVMADLGRSVILYCLLWLAMLIDWTNCAGTFSVLALLVVLVWSWDVRRCRTQRRLWEEVGADAFALGYLSEQEVESLSKRKKPPFNTDPELSAAENEIRARRYAEALQARLAGRDVPDPPGAQFDGIGMLFSATLLALYGAAVLLCRPVFGWMFVAGFGLSVLLLVEMLRATFFQTTAYRAVTERLESPPNSHREVGSGVASVVGRTGS